jgi:hypothetical protein
VTREKEKLRNSLRESRSVPLSPDTLRASGGIAKIDGKDQIDNNNNSNNSNNNNNKNKLRASGVVAKLDGAKSDGKDQIDKNNYNTKDVEGLTGYTAPTNTKATVVDSLFESSSSMMDVFLPPGGMYGLPYHLDTSQDSLYSINVFGSVTEEEKSELVAGPSQQPRFCTLNEDWVSAVCVCVCACVCVVLFHLHIANNVATSQ